MIQILKQCTKKIASSPISTAKQNEQQHQRGTVFSTLWFLLLLAGVTLLYQRGYRLEVQGDAIFPFQLTHIPMNHGTVEETLPHGESQFDITTRNDETTKASMSAD